MPQLPDDITYDAWLTYVFDHSVPRKPSAEEQQAHSERIMKATEKIQSGEATYNDMKDDFVLAEWAQWWFQNDLLWWNESANPATTVDYITRAFTEIAGIAGNYSDAQMDQGIYFIISNNASSHMFALIEPSVPLEKRVACVESFYTVYEKIYAEKCTQKLSSAQKTTEDAGYNPLNHTCYMWWDTIPFHAMAGETKLPDNLLPDEVAPYKERHKLDEPILQVMEKTLQIPHEACREGALHGLGHWQYRYEYRITAMIDRFLEANPTISPELRSYAQQARVGYVL